MSDERYKDRIMEEFFDELQSTRAQNNKLEDRVRYLEASNNTLQMPKPVQRITNGPYVTLLTVLQMRLREWNASSFGESIPMPFDYLTVIDNDRANEIIVFILKDGKEVILRDERGLYPSDKLITQMRLLMA